ncbi:MAG: hypothetical protein BMS9Abin10_0267 [Gammaproteobacteria bacterium]|nr:MAG: hypothetical protein BMS9Abin10_0267 [Gammaproteobacteria bacterium]
MCERGQVSAVFLRPGLNDAGKRLSKYPKGKSTAFPAAALRQRTCLCDFPARTNR